VAQRVTLPVFVALPAASTPITSVSRTLQWRVRVMRGELVLSASNSGVANVQVTSLSLTSPGAENSLADYTATQYVLAGQNRNWAIQSSLAQVAGTPLHIVATTNAGMLEADAVLENP
jgi:P pilus assembly chaperone PapD